MPRLKTWFCKTWEESRKLPEGNRLVWYTGAANVELWTEHWGRVEPQQLLDAARVGRYPFRRLFHRFLPKDRPVIEGGCGPGHIVLGLQRDGYDAVGVEWSRDVVQRVKAVAPDCNIRHGDILHLDFPDGHAGAYISFGVVEHFPEGPKRALAEAARVLAPGGWLILSVPYFNPLRRLKASWRLYPQPPTPPDPSTFYQYAFTAGEMARFLRAHGFQIVRTDGIGVVVGFGRECGRPGEWLRRFPPTERVLGLTEHLKPIRQLVGHSILFVARKGHGTHQPAAG